MNVEKLIEDGKKANAEAFDLMLWGDDCKCAGEEGFALGVRHTLAAMFPVVKVEDVKANEYYWCYFAEENVWQSRAGWYLQNSSHKPAEIRRCPTPGELWMGGA